jgi:hypothetical protein
MATGKTDQELVGELPGWPAPCGRRFAGAFLPEKRGDRWDGQERRDVIGIPFVRARQRRDALPDR